MSAQHTPGPWSFTNDPFDDGMPYIRIFAGKRYSEDGFDICGIMQPEDACLAAAAPELLAALQSIVSSGHAISQPLRWAARDAIEKATGR